MASKPINWKPFLWLLIISSLVLGTIGFVAAGSACGWGFILQLFEKGRCALPGSPLQIWMGSVATLALGMKFFWAGVGVWAIWRTRRAR